MRRVSAAVPASSSLNNKVLYITVRHKYSVAYHKLVLWTCIFVILYYLFFGFWLFVFLMSGRAEDVGRATLGGDIFEFIFVYWGRGAAVAANPRR